MPGLRVWAWNSGALSDSEALEPSWCYFQLADHPFEDVMRPMAYPFGGRNVFGRTVGMEGLGAHGVDGLVVSSRHFTYAYGI